MGSIFIIYGCISMVNYLFCIIAFSSFILFASLSSSKRILSKRLLTSCFSSLAVVTFLECSPTRSFLEFSSFKELFIVLTQISYTYGALLLWVISSSSNRLPYSGWWGGICCAGFMLILTRLVDLCNPELHDKLFGGKRILIVFAVIFAYLMYFLLYANPVLFNSVARSWIFDPLIYPDGSKVTVSLLTW